MSVCLYACICFRRDVTKIKEQRFKHIFSVKRKSDKTKRRKAKQSKTKRANEWEKKRVEDWVENWRPKIIINITRYSLATAQYIEHPQSILFSTSYTVSEDEYMRSGQRNTYTQSHTRREMQREFERRETCNTNTCSFIYSYYNVPHIPFQCECK